MNHNKETKFFSGKGPDRGYALALLLCAAAIGIGGFVYYRNLDTGKAEIPAADVAATTGDTPQVTRPVMQVPVQDDLVPAIGTAPTQPAADTPVAVTPEAGTSVMLPLDGESVAAFSMDSLAYNETTRDWRVHNGIDLAAEAGAEVCAAADGTVYAVYADQVMGTTVVLRHPGGYVTTYASLSDNPEVAPGDLVHCGQCLGYTGTTALTETALPPHVHFAVSKDGKAVDPEEFLGLAE